MKQLKDLPFVIVGVNTDEDREELKRVIQEEDITWRSFWDMSPDRRIAQAWNIRSFPSGYVIDHEGIIRGVRHRRPGIDQAIEESLVAMGYEVELGRTIPQVANDEDQDQTTESDDESLDTSTELAHE